MNKKLISLAIAGAVATPFAAQAGSITVANQDITVSGGITGAYLYTSEDTNGTAAGTKKDAFVVPDAIIDLSSAAKTGGMGFDLGIGTLGGNSLGPQGELTVIGSGTGNGGSTGSVGVQWGYVSVMPMDNLNLQAGLIPTNVGYEVLPSYADGNILRGLVFNAQPTYYTGARATYTWNNMSFYAEVNKNADVFSSFLATAGVANPVNPGFAIGASASVSGIDASVSYYSQVDELNIVDVIAKGKVGSITLGANLDYIMESNSVKNYISNNVSTSADNNALGIAFYGDIPVMDKVTIPVRVEYVSDGKSGIYGLTTTDSANNLVSNSAITFTVSPTYHFSDSTFVRAEVAYVTIDKKAAAGSILDPGPYVDDKGAGDTSAFTFGVQGGVLF